jgi:hypothetical protein
MPNRLEVGRSVTSPTNSARTVAGLMAFAVLFSLAGNEIDILTGNKPNPYGLGAYDRGVVIILGGFTGAALLVALTGAGESGRKFGVGLAGVTAASSLLVYGGPVWRALSTVVGGKPTGATKATGATKPTAPTRGTSTVVALTNVVD